MSVLRIVSTPRRSSESTRLNLRASSASEAAYDSPPTLTARYRPEPEETKLPDRTCSPTGLCSGSDSPVRSDSFSSRPADSTTSPSTTT